MRNINRGLGLIDLQEMSQIFYIYDGYPPISLFFDPTIMPLHNKSVYREEKVALENKSFNM